MRLLLTSAVSVFAICLAAASASAGDLPDDVKKSFVDTCTEKASSAHCECIFGKLEGEVNVDQLVAGNVSNEQIDKYTDTCLKEVPVPLGTWPSNIRKAFVDGCKADQSEEICECIAKSLEAKVLFADIMQGKADEAVQKEVSTCVAPPADAGAAPPAADGAAPSE